MKNISIVAAIILSFYQQASACGFGHLEGQLASSTANKQFPDLDRNYGSSDRGWNQYLAKSIHKTNQIVLTFDDGPHPINTPKLLDVLKKYNAKATFFAVGALIKKYPKISKRIVDEGHILAGHDWKHTNGNSETEKTFKTGLSSMVKQVKKYYVKKEMYYRFPYGAYGRARGYHHMNAIKEVSDTLFGDNCINFAFWDIDTSDWVGEMTAKDISGTIMANLDGGKAYRFKKTTVNGRIKYIKSPYMIKNPKGGGVILMHDIHAKTTRAMEIFLKKIQSRNIEIIHLNEVEEFQYSAQLCRLLSPL